MNRKMEGPVLHPAIVINLFKSHVVLKVQRATVVVRFSHASMHHVVGGSGLAVLMSCLFSFHTVEGAELVVSCSSGRYCVEAW